MHKYLPQERDLQSVEQESIFQRGIDAGVLAQELFPGGIDASPDAPYLYAQSIKDTARYIRQGHQIIYEAAFQYEGVMCAVDILVKEDNLWTAYEVKSSTSVKPTHLQDAALQYSVLKNSGIALKDFALVHINKHYIRRGVLDLKQLFTPQSLLADILPAQDFIEEKIIELLAVTQQTNSPAIEPGMHCLQPYPCDFMGFCGAREVLQKLQEEAQEDAPVENTTKGIETTINYPLHFLYTNTWLSAIPERDGDWPYRPVYFQIQGISLEKKHAISEKWAYVASSKWEADEAVTTLLLEKLRSDEGSILVANKEMQEYYLSTLAKANPKVASALNNIKRRLVELSAGEEEFTGTGTITSSAHAVAVFYDIPKALSLQEWKLLRDELVKFGEGELVRMYKIFSEL